MFICSYLSQIPVLSLDSKFFSDAPVVDISKVKIADIVRMADTPIVFSGAVAAFKDLTDDFSVFMKKVTDSVAEKDKKEKHSKAKSKDVPLKRVTDPVTQASLDKCSTVFSDTFFKVPDGSNHLFLEPCPDLQSSLATMETFDVLKSSCTSAWWAAGQNTTQTGPEANCVGSLRINFHGVRQYAAVDHGLWHTFVRRAKAGEQV